MVRVWGGVGRESPGAQGADAYPAAVWAADRLAEREPSVPGALFGSGVERTGDEAGRGRRRGFSRKRVAKVLEKGGELSRAELLRCQVRYFTDGAVPLDTARGPSFPEIAAGALSLSKGWEPGSS
jgi:hypothetical protein